VLGNDVHQADALPDSFFNDLEVFQLLSTSSRRCHDAGSHQLDRYRMKTDGTRSMDKPEYAPPSFVHAQTSKYTSQRELGQMTGGPDGRLAPSARGCAGCVLDRVRRSG
jgi:hypothetical protein